MKKNIIILILLLLTLNITFSYSATNKDNEILNKFYPKLDLICENSENQCKKLKKNIDKLSYKYKERERIYFLLTEISSYIDEKIKKQRKKLNIVTNVGINSSENINKNNDVNKTIITKVTDGDTIHFKKNGKKYITRLIGIDSPENSTTRYGYTEKFGNKAKDYLNNLILNKEVTIEYDESQAKIDRYGRHLVYIFYKGENINKKMIEQGLAKEYTYKKDYKYKKEFLKAQEYAKKSKKGIWSLNEEDTKKVIEQIDNHTSVPKNTCNIKGNISSKGVKIYHYIGCKSYNKTKISLDKGEKYFCSEKEAKDAGWRVARNCN